MNFRFLNKESRNKRVMFTVILFVLLTACKGGPSKGAANPKKEAKSIPVIVKKTELKDLKEYIKITGKLEGITDIALISETAGKVIEVHKTLGDWVEKGESIGRVDNTDYLIQYKQSEASVLSSEASLSTAQMNFDAVKNLHETGNASDSELLTAESSLKGAQAGLSGAKVAMEKARKALDNSNLVAPRSGYISNISIEEGDLLNMGSMVCNIVNTRKLIIRTGVGETNITKLKRGQEVQVYHKLLETSIKGKITGKGIKPEGQTANYPIEITLENPDRVLYPGMIIEGKILSKVYKDVIYTSLNNIKKQYDDNFVFTVSVDNKAVRKKVILGTQIEENVILKSGIGPDENLVVEGMDNLEDNVTVEIRK